jgi:hypothetical protein
LNSISQRRKERKEKQFVDEKNLGDLGVLAREKKLLVQPGMIPAQSD